MVSPQQVKHFNSSNNHNNDKSLKVTLAAENIDKTICKLLNIGMWFIFLFCFVYEFKYLKFFGF